MVTGYVHRDMRNPVRTEADAFHIVSGSAAVIGASAIVGALFVPIAGVALFAVAVVGVAVWEFGTNDPDRRRPLREAADAGHFARSRPRVLVVANRTLGSATLRGELVRRASEGAELRLVAPILCSRAHYIASDVDRETAEARGRLDAALAWAAAEGLDASGTVGDPMVAMGAIEDELRVSGTDEVIVSTHPPGRSNWLETGILERLRDELDIPVTHLIADPERAPVAG
jgi:hypothetical protein